MSENIFVKKTREGLSDNIQEDLIATRGFEVGLNDDKEEDCILVMGLNPAGDEQDAKRERDYNRNYFYSIGYGKSDSRWIYNKYYRPIYETINRTVKEGAKWPWCNKTWKEIEEEIHTYKDLEPIKKDIKEFFDKTKDNRYTIFVGEFFYYHETHAKELPLRKKIDKEKYCRDMLKLHISELKQHKKSIKYIYINNARVSGYFWPTDNYKTVEIIDGVKVFFGGMLSGQGAMDKYSRKRLIDEINNNI